MFGWRWRLCRVMKEMLDGKSELRLLYVTPEKCSKSKQFMTKLQKMYQMGRLDRIAIGEEDHSLTKPSVLMWNWIRLEEAM